MRPSRSTPLADTVLQCLAVLACFGLSAQAAWAYLDPVSTTFVLQAIAGAIAAAFAGVRSFRRRVVGFFKTGRFADPDAAPEAAARNKADAEPR